MGKGQRFLGLLLSDAKMPNQPENSNPDSMFQIKINPSICTHRPTSKNWYKYSNPANRRVGTSTQIFPLVLYSNPVSPRVGTQTHPLWTCQGHTNSVFTLYQILTCIVADI